MLGISSYVFYDPVFYTTMENIEPLNRDLRHGAGTAWERCTVDFSLEGDSPALCPVSFWLLFLFSCEVLPRNRESMNQQKARIKGI